MQNQGLYSAEEGRGGTGEAGCPQKLLLLLLTHTHNACGCESQAGQRCPDIVVKIQRALSVNLL